MYERRFDMLYRVARDRTSRDESFALDCVQDAMLRVANSLPHIDRLVSLDAWLRRAVLTTALDRLRSERSRTRREGTIAQSRSEATLGDAEGDALLRAIQAELDVISSDDRTLLSLRFRRGLTLAQLAEHLGLAPSAVDSRIRRLLARLRLSRAHSGSTEESR